MSKLTSVAPRSSLRWLARPAMSHGLTDSVAQYAATSSAMPYSPSSVFTYVLDESEKAPSVSTTQSQGTDESPFAASSSAHVKSACA